MISYQALLLEIEHLVASTKNHADEQYLREQLSAIRALCNVGLSKGTKTSTHGQNSSTIGGTYPAQSFQSSPMPIQPQNIIQNTNSFNGAKLEENDANGESIFDF
ncbi:YwdI family protein [Ureibacillus sinduriensis]|uniref:Uncharacterized protein n=1 Tax=Ureibacillus sinduriensis BLB-1 = JCM 15800 TaxID=1384057 RepID=A0A0A3HU02_9BACL|nr:YwdI family protein [Ureibacillus sinduriensis]KGR75919.1 hypothetical protein CD33_08735 [Ureibacillus sinduriensis BLB-1 = JCM 15800]